VREAQAAAALDHPVICAVHDIELRPDGEVCIVMQYIDGETLASRLGRGPLAVREALMLTTELADALAVAHKRGIVHRDIKPQNIMVTAAGRAKLLDFGIATLADAIAVTSADAETTEGTRQLAAGTPPYMSPEQLTGGPIDGRSDLFSLGCVLYECLTGRPAFRGRNALEISGQVLHVHPPAPSTLRSELTAEHDELVRRLLAKDPVDRFQSSEELLGALRLLLHDTARDRTRDDERPSTRTWRWVALAMVAVAGIAGFAWWYSTRPVRLPAAPSEAARWFERGTNSIREGAYYAAKLALKQALAIFPEYPQAHTRLAEALIELDEGEAARDALLAANRLAQPARLPPIDKVRNEAIQAMLLRDHDGAIKAHRRLIDLQQDDAGAWVDLARVQEIAGLWSDARQSLATALARDKQNAVAHLRLGILEAQEGRRQEALTAFAEAERLYRAAADLEGVAETVFQRGAFLDGLGEVKEARTALELARTMAAATNNKYQMLRADLRLSSVAAAEGQYDASQKLADDAIRGAREADLDTVAADGLIELGATLMQNRQLDAAEAKLKEAIAIAEREKARGVALRATLNLASLRQTQGRPAEAISVAESALEPLRTRRERRKVLSALAIVTRAQQDLEQYARAREIAQQLLAGAQEIGDQPSLALAYESLAAQATVFGDFPVALDYRARVEEIHRRLADASNLPFDLTNRGEMLIRLGRTDDADAPLREVEEGIGRQVDAFVGRRRRVLLLRALQATTTGRFPQAREYARAVIGSTGPRSDETGQTAAALLAYIEARTGVAKRGSRFTEPDARLAVRREILYWQLAAALAAGDAQQALDGVRTALQQLSAAPSDEYAWRLAALGVVAAKRLTNAEEALNLHARAKDALGRVRASWGEHAGPYERRSDLTELRTRAGL
jgi:tetratricopeptide (TPR) repeat protein